MRLICLSVSHHQAPVELRECLVLNQPQLETILSGFKARAPRFQSIEELVLLSTCNRLELYALVATGDDGQKDGLEAVFEPAWLCLEELLGGSGVSIRPFVRLFTGLQTAHHLFQVAAGLDSIAIGETQILGQVSDALDTAMRLGSARHGLSSLFRAAIHSGKRVQTETHIGHDPTNLSEIAVQLAGERLGSLTNYRILIAGAGRMGKLTAAALAARGARKVRVTSRTRSHAEDVAARYGFGALPFGRLGDGLRDADLLLATTAAAQPILDRERVAAVMHTRPDTPLTMIDLGVPRNIDPGAIEIYNVELFNMDDIQAFAAGSAASYPWLARARRIVEEEVSEFGKLLRIMPLIGELHRKADEIRQREVERALQHLPGLDPAVSEQFELLSRSLVRKLLHEPTVHLREESDPEILRDYVLVLSKMFDLEQQGQNLLLE